VRDEALASVEQVAFVSQVLLSSSSSSDGSTATSSLALPSAAERWALQKKDLTASLEGLVSGRAFASLVRALAW
jgi:hypothetical protein